MKKQNEQSRRADIEMTTRDNREVWRIASNGKIKTITTTASSTAAMDEAMEIYGRALERLANRFGRAVRL